jgi:hypothetical protein
MVSTVAVKGMGGGLEQSGAATLADLAAIRAPGRLFAAHKTG